MSRAQAFALRITTCARHQLNALNPAERQLIAAHLAQLSGYLARHPAAAGPQIDRGPGRPPVTELRVWPFLVLYECYRAERALTVLHVLRIPYTPAASPQLAAW